MGRGGAVGQGWSSRPKGAVEPGVGVGAVRGAEGSEEEQRGWLKRGWPWHDPPLPLPPLQPWSPVGGGRKERPKPREPAARLEKAKQKSAQQELKQRQRAEIYALNRVMTELEQQQFDSFCKQMQASGE
ncbi:small vasohibin-binding protein isoform X2 [Aquila chrysaetos chrysaetos]|uniref:small vasohibin-binding protein isoform X2 n=1 Tax=Aquila chrysaetos chrysaetos TaxID=223781 RepID=UPI0011764AB3|nr:small vasohibin-binding protein isoform X2 [Aquila chrysaetos chrysaetos]